jgi:hypothetical protein
MHGQRFITPHDLGLDANSTVHTPNGSIYNIGTSLWAEIRADWHFTDVVRDPFQDIVKGRSYNGRFGMPGKSSPPSSWSDGRIPPAALIYSLRARASDDEFEEYLVHRIGRDITVALHYQRRVIGEVSFSRLLREEYLLGLPLILYPHMPFGVLVAPMTQIVPPFREELREGRVELSLTGFLFESDSDAPEKDALAQRYEELLRIRR